MAQENFTNQGAGIWVCPDGVTEIQIECWGGGGGGGNSVDSYYRVLAGGGGGAYSKKNSLAVVPGNSYNYFVGGQSQDTWFKSTSDVLAKGGVSSVSNADGRSSKAGGQASAGVGDVKYSGGNSGTPNLGGVIGGTGGSSAGTASDGATGTAPTGGGDGGIGLSYRKGTVGTNPGGGGGGNCYDAGGYANGAAGKIVLTYTAITGSSNFFQLF